MEELFAIPARETIGRIKSVPEEEYVSAYAALAEEMKRQIQQIAAKGGEEG